MRDKQSELNVTILGAICKHPGITIAQVVENVSQKLPEGTKPPSKDTIRRRIYRLGALGFLSLRQEITIYPTQKGRELAKNAGNAAQPREDERHE